MNTTVDWLSDAYIRHPLVQTIGYYLGKAFLLGFFLIMVWVCLFLCFGKNRRYTFPPGSLSDKCWQVSWLLQIVALLVLGHAFYEKGPDLKVSEISIIFSPYILLVAAFILAHGCYKTTGKALLEAEEAERKEHGRHNPPTDNSRI